MSRAIAFAIGAIVLLLSGRAAAAPSMQFPVSIESSEPPDIVCALARAPSSWAIGPAQITKDVFRGKNQDAPSGDTWSFQADGDFHPLKPPAPAGSNAQEWDYTLERQRGLLQRTYVAIAQSTKLPPLPPNSACTEEDAACRDELDPTMMGHSKWLSILCADAPAASARARSGKARDQPRVALLGFDFLAPNTNDEPLLREVYFDGHIFTADFTHDWSADPAFSIASLGGGYKPALPRVGGRASTTLELVPHCVSSTVTLPRIARDSSAAPQPTPQATVTLSDRTCRAPVAPTGEFDLILPVESSDAEHSFTVTMGSALGESEFRGGWHGKVPPATVVAEPTKISFAWEASCLYAEPACPVVDLPDVGARCQGTWRGHVCVYSACALSASGASATPVDRGVILPLSATFWQGDATWTDRIVAVDQRLRGFVSPDEYQIEVDASRWVRMPLGDEVTWIAVTTPDGETRRVELSAGQRLYKVAVPRIRCSDNLTSQAYGQRRYEDGVLPVVGDHVIPGPVATAHTFAFGLDAAFAWVLPLTTGAFRGASRKPSVSNLGGEIGGWLSLRPPASSLVYELQADFLYADRQAFGPRAPDSVGSGNVDIRYYRAPIVATVGRSLGGRLGVGIGGGVVFGGPFYDSAGIGFPHTDVSGSVLGYLRFRVGRDFALESRFSAFIAEALPVYDTDFRGGVVRQDGQVTSILITLGLRWDIASGGTGFWGSE